MDSRLLTNLNAQASGTRDPVVWAMAVCRAAAHFAGHGKTQEALQAIGVVREEFGKDLHFDIASWLMLAEGVLHFHRAEFPEAYDRVRRAYGLAIALKNVSAFPSCAAWMAHLEYNAGRFDDMAKHLREAAQAAPATDHQAIARYSMIMAVAYHIAGEFELSRPWYEKARLNAAAEGDNATVSATLHNMAATRAANVRLVEAFGGEARAEIRRVVLENASSYTYDQVIGIQALDFLSRMLNGLICTIDARFAEALAIFQPMRVNEIPAKFRALVLVDQAWCLARTGSMADSQALVPDIVQATSAVTEHDDLAYIHCRLQHMHLLFGMDEDARHFGVLAERELARHRQFQAGLLATLNALDLNAPK